MRKRPLLGFLFLLVAACGQKPAPTPEPTATTGTPDPTLHPAPPSEEDIKRLADAVSPLGWGVNSHPDDKKPRTVAAPILRMRTQKQTDESIAKLVTTLSEVAMPVILDFGFVETPAINDWIAKLKEARSVVGIRCEANVIRGPVSMKPSIPALAQMTWLEWLTFADKEMTDGDFAPLSALTQLKVLEVGESKLTCASYAHLAKMTELRRFNLNLALEVKSATDAQLVPLGKLTKLEELTLDLKMGADDALRPLMPLTALRKLTIHGARKPVGRTTAALYALAGLTNLEEFEFDDTDIHPAAFTQLAALQKLRLLKFRPAESQGALAMQYIGTLTQLEEVDLGNASNTMTDEALAHMKKMTRLKRLSVMNSPVTDAGLKHLEGMTELREVFLGGSAVKGPGLEVVGKLPMLEVLNLFGSKIDEGELVRLRGAANLRWVNLTRATVGDAGLKHLAGLPKLATLDLAETAITDASVETLKQMPGLRSVNVGKTKMTQKGVDQLKANRNLYVSFGNF
jgi:hypothetical protein